MGAPVSEAKSWSLKISQPSPPAAAQPTGTGTRGPRPGRGTRQGGTPQVSTLGVLEETKCVLRQHTSPKSTASGFKRHTPNCSKTEKGGRWALSFGDPRPLDTAPGQEHLWEGRPRSGARGPAGWWPCEGTLAIWRAGTEAGGALLPMSLLCADRMPLRGPEGGVAGVQVATADQALWSSVPCTVCGGLRGWERGTEATPGGSPTIWATAVSGRPSQPPGRCPGPAHTPCNLPVTSSVREAH